MNLSISKRLTLLRALHWSYMFVALFATSSLIGQGVTKVSGHVLDKSNNQPIPFVNVYFKGTNIVTATDLDGYFELETRYATRNICATFMSYKELCQEIKLEEKQKNLEIKLEPEVYEIENVTVVAKKGKYVKEGNPAVMLMEKVIENKQKNRLEGQPYYSFDQYERIGIDLNNITEEFKNRKIFNKFGVIWNYLDTSKINGKIFLPIYLTETKSKVYYHQDPESRKEYREAIKMTKFDEKLDDKSLTDALDFLYQDINIYDNSIHLLDNNFVSPISGLALNFYRFYILDTLVVNDQKSIRIGFIPANKANFGFTGDLYVALDSTYHVTKVDFGIIGDINLNFVRDLKIRQDFKPYKDSYILTNDQITIDYGVSQNSIGFYGTRTLAYSNFNFEPNPDPGVYGGLENVIIAKDAYKHDESYWDQARIIPLTKNEQDLYKMLDTLTTLPAYKNLVTGVRILTTGYIPANVVDIGPLGTFVSYNDVEGFRARFGLETNFNFNKKILLEGYGAYGFSDKVFKHRASIAYSFREDYRVNPRHSIKLVQQNDVTFPGQSLMFIQGDNAVLSIRRGNANRMIFNNEYRVEYQNEMPGMSLDFALFDLKTRPYGQLTLPYTENGQVKQLESINQTGIELGFEYSPNKQYVQGRQYRTPIVNDFPIITLRYEQGFNGLLRGKFNYKKLELGYYKRFNLSVLGQTNMGLEAGKLWGELPYVSLFVPRANQSFSYQRESFNMMNFMEFVADQYVYFRAEHFFQGFFFNKIPLLRELKLRELVTFKLFYGSLSDKNNPELNPQIPQFSRNSLDQPLTYVIKNKPYVEASFGVTNIFKVLRLDILKRFNYLDHPDLPKLFGGQGLGIRARFKVDF